MYEFTGRHSHKQVPFCRQLLLALFFYVKFLLGFLYRAIVTPLTLPWTKPWTSAQMLLTPYERQWPWTLYTSCSSGLFVAQALYTFVMEIAMYASRNYLVRVSPYKTSKELFQASEPKWVGAHVGLAVLATVLITPLSVIIVRMSVQRNGGPSKTVDSNKPSSEKEKEVEQAQRAREIEVLAQSAVILCVSFPPLLQQ